MWDSINKFGIFTFLILWYTKMTHFSSTKHSPRISDLVKNQMTVKVEVELANLSCEYNGQALFSRMKVFN